MRFLRAVAAPVVFLGLSFLVGGVALVRYWPFDTAHENGVKDAASVASVPDLPLPPKPMMQRAVEKTSLQSLGTISRLGPGSERSRQMRAILAGASASKIRDALQHLLQEEPTSPADIRMLLAAWQELDPADAFSFADEFLPMELRDAVLQPLYALWVQRDPSSAFAWAAIPGRDPTLALSALRQICRTDVSQAILLAGTLNGHSAAVQRDAYHIIIDAATNRGDFQTSADWLRTISDPDLRLSLTGYMLRIWSQQTPTVAAGWLFTQPDGPERQSLLGVLMHAWADKAPADAAYYAVKLPPGPVRQMAFGQVVNQWLATDMSGASDWIDALEPSPDFDSAIYGVATYGHIAPEIALAWAQSIFDPNIRVNAIGEVIRTLANTDPQTARVYLESARLTAEQRAEIIETLPPITSPGS